MRTEAERSDITTLVALNLFDRLRPSHGQLENTPTNGNLLSPS
jgi:hypothetical protein